MTNLVNFTSKSDSIGVLASALCFLHCLATPFVFVAQTGLGKESILHPWWWSGMDMVFMAFSFFAVYWSARNTSKQQVKYALWGLWSALTLTIVNEKLEVVHVPEAVIYLLAISLISVHYYNQRYCCCEGNDCCTNINT